jgi:6,7-dimethyl-8-ribityllumazine synthase
MSPKSVQPKGVSLNNQDQIKTIEGHLNASGKKFGIVVSRFNELISQKLLSGALDCLIRHGVNQNDLTLVWVPGSFELPLAAANLAKSNTFDAIICLGAVIRGGTPHFDFIAAEVAKGIAQASLQYLRPISFGVLTTDTLEQALERAGSKAGNKGWDAALGAIEMADLWGKLR